MRERPVVFQGRGLCLVFKLLFPRMKWITNAGPEAGESVGSQESPSHALGLTPSQLALCLGRQA